MPQRQHPSRDTGATYYKTDLVLVAVGQRFKALAVRLALPPNRAQPSAVLRRHISPARVARARSATAEELGRCTTSEAQAARLSPRKGPRQRRPCTSARAFADSRRTHLHQLALIHELAAPELCHKLALALGHALWRVWTRSAALQRRRHREDAARRPAAAQPHAAAAAPLRIAP